MRYGSLFTGIGGLDLAVEHVLGATCVWQAEREPYRRRVLERHWPGVQRFADVGDIGAGAAPVDLVCGGFVCKDISNAGRRAGIAGARSGGTWGHFRRILAELRPPFAFVENVAALRSRGLDTVLDDLAALGLDAEWTTLRASDAGAPHDRNRIWVLAYADRERLRELAERVERSGRRARAALGGDALDLDDRAQLADAAGLRGAAQRFGGPRESDAHGEELADADHDRRGGQCPPHDHGRGDAPGHDDARRRARALLDGPDWPPDRAASAEAWAAWLARNPGCEPGIRRAPDGLPGRLVDAWKRERRERLAALGDAASPQQAALALRILIDRATDERTQS